MKYLIIITLLAIASCNPLNFGDTKLIHLESDQMDINFECNDKIVADWSGWFEWAKKDNSYKIDHLGVRVYKTDDRVKIRYTLKDGYQTEASYPDKNYNKISECIPDTILFTNLKVWY